MNEMSDEHRKALKALREMLDRCVEAAEMARAMAIELERALALGRP